MKIMNSSISIALLLFGITMLTILGCTKNKTTADDIPPICETLNIAYNDEIKTIIDMSCAVSGCHDGTTGIGDFGSYNGLLSRLDNGLIRERTIDTPVSSTLHMPPSGMPELTQEEKDMLLCWILEGYPEN